jgi:sialic acid synthase SpsE
MNNQSSAVPKCLIVAEVAQAHDGSLGMAQAFIDAIANAGADAVKFQTHIVNRGESNSVRRMPPATTTGNEWSSRKSSGMT